MGLTKNEKRHGHLFARGVVVLLQSYPSERDSFVVKLAEVNIGGGINEAGCRYFDGGSITEILFN